MPGHSDPAQLGKSAVLGTHVFDRTFQAQPKHRPLYRYLQEHATSSTVFDEGQNANPPVVLELFDLTEWARR